MNLLVIDPHADGLLDLAVRGCQLGHVVRYFCRDPGVQRGAPGRFVAVDLRESPVGRGLVDRVPDWRPSMTWADLVLVACNYQAQELYAWQKRGVPMIGAQGPAAEWELDRIAGMKAFEQAKIPVPAYRHFTSLEQAAAYVKKEDRGFAIKPSGDVTDKGLSCVFKTAREGIWRLERWKRQGKKFPSGLVVQDRIAGVECGVGAWIGPGGFAGGWEENFEEKRLFAGNVGPNCGEAGTVMRLVKKSKLAEKVLRPLEDKIVDLGYVGNIDVNCIVDDEGEPWPLEWTVRFGYPAVNIELALHSGDPIEFLAAVASGEPPTARRLDEIAVGVVMALPPNPFGHEKAEEVIGVPIWGVTPSIEDNLHLTMAQIDRGGDLATAGSYVLVSSGVGRTVVDARATAYRVLDRLTVPASPFWRVDIGSRLRAGLPALQRRGFALGLDYA